MTDEAEVAEVEEVEEENAEAEADGAGEEVAMEDEKQGASPDATKDKAGKKTTTDDSEAGKAAPDWPEDWRERIAEDLSAGDKKAYDKAIRQLGRYDRPSGPGHRPGRLKTAPSRRNCVRAQPVVTSV